ncbi:MAG: hypothetical protein ACR2NZ_06435, partial [Rubripirellula sp.]
MIRTDCVFRTDVRSQGQRETANCGLVQAISGARVFRVAEEVCRSCQGGSIERAIGVNPVLPSLVFQACQDQIASLETKTNEHNSDAIAARLQLLKQRSNQSEKLLVTECMNS